MNDKKIASNLPTLYANALKINSLCCWQAPLASTMSPIFRFSTE
jgi:hypothetical protein